MIGIDLDGVLTEFCYPFTRLAREINVWGNAAYRTPEQDRWSFPFDAERVWRAVDDTYNWWMTLPPLALPEEIEMLNGAIDRHDGVAFITSRRHTKGFPVETQARLWLQSVGIHADERCPVIATKAKGIACQHLDVNVFLDDKPENLADLQRSGVLAVMRRWRYNRFWSYESVGSIGEFLTKYS